MENKYWKYYYKRMVLGQNFILVAEFIHTSTQLSRAACSPTLFTQTFQYFYTDISAISVTFRNSEPAVVISKLKIFDNDMEQICTVHLLFEKQRLMAGNLSHDG